MTIKSMPCVSGKGVAQQTMHPEKVSKMMPCIHPLGVAQKATHPDKVTKTMPHVNSSQGGVGVMVQNVSKNTDLMRPPVNYVGRKIKPASIIWQRLGKVRTFIDPCCGSAAVPLMSPFGAPDREILNDINGFVCNFHRAMRNHPRELAAAADRPTLHQDFGPARALLRKVEPDLTERQFEDLDYCDIELAGLWAWVQCISIDLGSGISDGYYSKGRYGEIILPADRYTAPDNNDENYHPDRDVFTGDRLYAWFKILSDRLRRSYILCKDWSKLFSPSVTGINKSKIGKMSNPTCGIFFDPPYNATEGMYTASNSIALDIFNWCVENGNNPNYRICLAGYSDDYPDFPDGWTKETWLRNSGMEVTGGRRDTVGKRQEVLWFSPYCLPSANQEGGKLL